MTSTAASAVKGWVRRRGSLLGSVTGTTSPAVVVTLDDGPDPVVTPRMLEVLARHQATATFFVLLTRVRRHEDVLREVLTAGHEVALHGPDHRALSQFSVRDVGRRTAAARAELEDVTGRPVRWFRPPYGRQSPGRWAAVRRTGLEPVLWSATTWDWRPGVSDDDRLARAMTGCRPGGILLAHDGIADDRDLVSDDPAPEVDRAALLDRVLGGLSDRGLSAASLDQALIDGRTVRTMEFSRL
jgi:peptidoglycan/xylan/chitin deacetylase (PgdA/CDA1 family)